MRSPSRFVATLTTAIITLSLAGSAFAGDSSCCGGGQGEKPPSERVGPCDELLALWHEAQATYQQDPTQENLALLLAAKALWDRCSAESHGKSDLCREAFEAFLAAATAWQQNPNEETLAALIAAKDAYATCRKENRLSCNRCDAVFRQFQAAWQAYQQDPSEENLAALLDAKMKLVRCREHWYGISHSASSKSSSSSSSSSVPE